MRDDIELRSVLPLERLNDLLAELPTRLARAAETVRDVIERRIADIRLSRERLASELREAEAAAAGADEDDDVSALEAEVAGLRERLLALDHAIARIEQAEGRHRSAARQMEAVRDRLVPRAYSRLGALIGDVRAYSGIRVPTAASQRGDASRSDGSGRHGTRFPLISPDAAGELEYWAAQAIENADAQWADFSNLSKEERLGIGAIRFYTRFGYKAINADRRVGSANEFADILDWAVGNIDALPRYRGVCRRYTEWFPQFDSIYIEGNIVRDPAPMSTSLDAVQAEFFGVGAHYFIKSKTGREIATVSGFASEREVLFRGGTLFKVLKVKKLNDETVVFMTEI